MLVEHLSQEIGYLFVSKHFFDVVAVTALVFKHILADHVAHRKFLVLILNCILKPSLLDLHHNILHEWAFGHIVHKLLLPHEVYFLLKPIVYGLSNQ